VKRESSLAMIAILIGLAGWWWWHRRDEPAASGPPAPAATAARPGAQPGGAPAEARGGGEAPTTTVVVDDDPRGALRLEGVVFDADDKPVGGATVALSSNPPRTATTEADGTFAFDALVGRPYTLTARAAVGVAGPVTARLTDKSEPVVLRLRQAGRVTITLVGTDGKPVGAATVELRGVDVQTQAATAGQAVFAQVVPGPYDVVGWAPGMAHAYGEVLVGSGDARAKLILAGGAAVAGKVVDEAGAPVAAARVLYQGASDGRIEADPRRDAALTDSAGVFRFEALPAGSFRFIASHAEQATGTSALITLDGRGERAGVTITLPKGATVRGRVADGNQQPVAGARVRIGAVGRGAPSEPPRQAYSDARGQFEIKGLPRRELAAVALHDSGASPTARLDTSRGDVADLALTIDVTGTIAGVVVDSAGQPLEGIQVQASPNFRRGRGPGGPGDPGGLPGGPGGPGGRGAFALRGMPQELTDGAGRFTLTGLPPGSYLVRASRRAGGGRRFGGEGTEAEAGAADVKIVLQAEGGVRGKVAYPDGTAPALFTVIVGPTQQSFAGGDGGFALDALPPQDYQVTLRGPGFQTKVLDVTVEPGKVADLGGVTVATGRRIAGVVVDPQGAPVANATVYAGRQLRGDGTSNDPGTGGGPFGQGTKTDTTGPDGSFGLAGFNDGDLTVVAELASVGRSKARLVAADAPDQASLQLQLQPFGALRGTLAQGGKPAGDVMVTCQSTSTPGAVYMVASGPDGAYRFDQLAPDTYKVSATLGMPMRGMKFYSKQVDLPPGKEVVVDLAVEPGAATIEVTAAPRAGELGVASVWLSSGALAAATSRDLALHLAAAGPGASQWMIIRRGEPASFTEVAARAYTACVVPFPAEVRGMAAMGYADRHGDKLPAFCAQLTVGTSPTQALSIAVDLPPFIPDPDQPTGGRGGPGRGGRGGAQPGPGGPTDPGPPPP
jgi:protocatechuate 3,4-dioxygenase beta subunit